MTNQLLCVSSIHHYFLIIKVSNNKSALNILDNLNYK